jgi:acyl-CoA synthetase (AMP-forming)/AMP-acid ligase II
VPSRAGGPQDLASRWRRDGHWADRTLPQELRRAAAEHPGSLVVFHDSAGELVTTVGGLHARALRVAAGLGRLGVRPGDAVAIQVPNWPEGAVAHAAGWLAGALVVPIAAIYGPAEVSFILRQSAARVFIVARHWRGRDCAGLLAGLGSQPALSHVVVIGEQLPATTAWADLESDPQPAADGASPPAVISPEADPDDPCLLVYTSGTTAEPKGVQHSHNTLLSEVRGTAAARRAPGTKQLAAFPAGHVAGVLGLLRVLVLGVPSVIMDAWDPVTAASLVAGHRVTSAAGAPVYLATMLDAAQRSGHDLSSLTEFLTGAADVSPELIERADRAGIAAYRCYGSSEHPTISSGVPADPLVKRATTDGRVNPGNEVRIVDDEGSELPPGVNGEIVSRGPEQFLGYLASQLDADAYLPGGWLRSGDLGHLDDDGYLTVTGRKKDIIVRGGEKISAKEVEDVLLRHPAVAEAALVGAPDQRYGERACAFVVLRPGASLDLAEVQRHFAGAGLARQKTPEQLVITTALPRTAAGKVQKFALRATLADTTEE